MTRFTKASLLLVAMMSIGSMAYAGHGEENDAMPVMNAKIPLSQAVSAAEQHVNGKAARAEYERTKIGWAYDVEVVSGAKVYDVRVDANKGTVISSVEDKAEHDDGHDKRD